MHVPPSSLSLNLVDFPLQPSASAGSVLWNLLLLTHVAVLFMHQSHKDRSREWIFGKILWKITSSTFGSALRMKNCNSFPRMIKSCTIRRQVLAIKTGITWLWADRSKPRSHRKIVGQINLIFKQATKRPLRILHLLVWLSKKYCICAQYNYCSVTEKNLWAKETANSSQYTENTKHTKM